MSVNKVDEYLNYKNNLRYEFFQVCPEQELLLFFDANTESDYLALINLYNQNCEER